MTDTVIGREEEINSIPHTVIMLISAVLMIVALVLSVKLLNWAVTDKLSKTEEIVGSDVTAQVRERQLGCLAKNIYHEAANEPFEGKAAVAQVTLNRVASGKFPDDICKTIYQKNIFYERVLCQFSWTCDRNVKFRPMNQAAYDESMAVAKKVLLEGFRLPSLKNALYYHAAYIDPKWNRKRITRIGQHIFYE
jgi:spore germination cell wall hydrolase CwlJ-like protein